MSETTFDRVASLLNKHGVSFQVLLHDPVYTSEEAARVRGTPLAIDYTLLRPRPQLDIDWRGTTGV
jgi:hypothetical protein